MTDANAVTQEVDPETIVVVVPPNGPPGGAPGGTPVPDPNAGQQQQLAQAVPYQSTFYTGHLPAPTGEVGQFINRTVSTAGLKDRAEACFDFLNDPTVT